MFKQGFYLLPGLSFQSAAGHFLYNYPFICRFCGDGGDLKGKISVLCHDERIFSLFDHTKQHEKFLSRFGSGKGCLLHTYIVYIDRDSVSRTFVRPKSMKLCLFNFYLERSERKQCDGHDEIGYKVDEIKSVSCGVGFGIIQKYVICKELEEKGKKDKECF